MIYFNATLIWLHIKIRKMGLTAYEFFDYENEKEERFELLRLGEITQEQFNEEEKKAMDEIRKRRSPRSFIRSTKRKRSLIKK
jgi:hypothetical protein